MNLNLRKLPPFLIKKILDQRLLSLTEGDDTIRTNRPIGGTETGDEFVDEGLSL
jgi:hypothetical protein